MGAITAKMKGKAKRVEGKVTGDRVRETQGAMQETGGKIEGAIDRVKNRVNARVEKSRAKRSARRSARAR